MSKKRRLHYLQHVPYEGLGEIAGWADHHGWSVTKSLLYAGDNIPSLEAFDMLVILGGSMSVHDDAAYPWMREEKRFIERTITAGKCLIGICLGAQMAAQALGAKIHLNSCREIGWFPVERTEDADKTSLLKKFPHKAEVFHWHGDSFDIPNGALHVLKSEGCANQAFVYDERVVGIQCHLETTEDMAKKLIKYCDKDMVPGPFVQSAEELLRKSGRFKEINHLLEGILERFAAKASPHQ